MTSVRGVVRWVSALLLIGSTAACLDAEDHAEVTVYLSWDEREAADSFRGVSCATAGVDRMEWRLIRTNDGVQVAEGVDACCSPGGVCDASIDWVLISDPSPGDYTLEISGIDSSDQARWGAQCEGLHVTRFDRTYRCEVPSPPEPQ